MTMDFFFVSAALVLSSSGSYFQEATIQGATLNIEIRQPVDREKAEEIVDWVVSAAENVNLVYGRFPNPNPTIVVIPGQEYSWGSDSSVTFGRVTRYGGEKVELFVNADRPIEEFYADWTATHEFSHLMLPLLSGRYRWISEGFATYYQNILMARAGHYAPESAWKRLNEGFIRGRDSRPDLSPNEAAAGGIRHARMKVYWSGAVLALQADVELRRRSEGKQSLDSVLGQLQACCLPSQRRWSGPALFEKLDSFLDEPLFMPLYHEHANRDGFPNFVPLLTDLGVMTTNGGLTLNDNAPSADIRIEISRRH